MRSPHRPVRVRLRRLAMAAARRMPAPSRRRIRGLEFEQARLLRSTRSALPVISRLATPTLERLAEWGPRARPSTAEIVRKFDAWQVQRELADSLASVLAAAGIEFVRATNSGRHLIVVAAENRAAAFEALALAPAAASWWAVPSAGARPLRVRDLAAARHRITTFRVFRHLAAPNGAVLAHDSLFVVLSFWQTVRGKHKRRSDGGFHLRGTRLAPTRNILATYLDPTTWAAAQGVEGHFLPLQQRPRLLDMTDPIDAVYTWVDGDDPDWAARLAAVSHDDPSISADALIAGRYADRGELRYSLRSLEMYAGWVRRIFIVTDGQVPGWLNTDHPKITVVAHREIFKDPSCLPTFNSHAIESQLHRIPGLAEHFLYLNDDFFLARPLRPEHFFHGNGIPKIFPSNVSIDPGPPSPDDIAAASAAKNNRTLLEERFGRTINHRLQHAPFALLKSCLVELEDLLGPLHDNVMAARFRSCSDYSIPSSLAHYYAYLTGRAVSGSLRYRYIDFLQPHAQEYCDELLAYRDFDVFCVNDVADRRDESSDMSVMEFLERYYPLVSSFERPWVKGDRR